MTTAERFLADIEAFLVAKRLDATAFGRLAMNDPTFVFRLRKGRQVSLRTMDRAKTFMESYVSDADRQAGDKGAA